MPSRPPSPQPGSRPASHYELSDFSEIDESQALRVDEDSRHQRRSSRNGSRPNSQIEQSGHHSRRHSAVSARQSIPIQDRANIGQMTLHGRHRRPSYIPPEDQDNGPRLPSPLAPWQSNVVNVSSSGPAHEYEGRISNQLERRGNMEDATCQVDSRYFFEVLPSERRLVENEAYAVRDTIQTIMPYNSHERSITLESRELHRVASHPTTREMRTMTRQGSSLGTMSNFKMVVGRRARERQKEERKKMGFFGRRWADLEDLWVAFQEFQRQELITVWTKELRSVENTFGGAYASYFEFSRTLLYMNIVICLILMSLVIAEGLVDRDWTLTNVDYIPYFPLNTSTNSSFFFYSGYSPTAVGGSYLMDLGYFCAVCLVFAFSFLSIAQNLREHILHQFETSDEQLNDKFPYTSAIFATYDYSVHSHRGVKALQLAITNNIKTMMDREENKELIAQKYTGQSFFFIILKRIAGNIFVLGMLVLMGYLIFYFTEHFPSIQTIAGSLRPTSLLVSAFNVTLPMIFYYVGLFEDYADLLVSTRIHLARSYVVKITSIYVLLLSYLNYATNPLQNSIVASKSGNWETDVGEDLYDIVWINGILIILATVGTAIFDIFYARYFEKASGYRHYTFSLSDSILELIYTQCVSWIGFVYSPVVPIFTVLFGVAIFHVKYFILHKFGLHPDRLFSSARITTFFITMLLVTLIVSGIPIAYALSTMKPSCGPWNGLLYAYEVIPNIVATAPLAVGTVVSFLASATILVPLIFLLGMVIYFLRALNQKRQDRVRELEEELLAEREDKRYLLRFYRVQL